MSKSTLAPKLLKKAAKKPITLKKIKKRDGTLVAFDENRIVVAVGKAMKAAGEGTERDAAGVARAVTRDLLAVAKKVGKTYLPTVEEIQNLVEKQLILHNFVNVSKAYILYRQRRAELRQQRGDVPTEVRQLATESKKYFRNALSEFVYYTTYSRWLPEKGRRETWLETVERYLDFMREQLGDKLHEPEYAELREYMLKMGAMGSMRLLWSAGKAVRKNHVCAYNCAFIAPTKWQDFAEVMYVLMSGTGMGYSVEHQTVEMLPMVKKQTGEPALKFTVPDSREGWCDAFALGLKTWADGHDIAFDYSQVRPAGARLRPGALKGPLGLHPRADAQAPRSAPLHA